jgi:hypothetical protein
MTLSNARSNSLGSSDASTSRAVSRKRLWRSVSVSFGKRFRGIFFTMPHNVASSKGSSSWRGSASRLGRRHDRGRLGRLCCPLATSCLIGQPLAFDTLQGEIGPCNIANSELNAIGIAEIKFAQIPFQMRL